MKRLKKYYPFVLIIAIVCVYYWKVFLKGYIPFPGDLLVGAYFPWLSQKWGTIAGVPIRNPLISDVFSQFYVWKSLIAESYKNLEFPLWNPYSYFGYPLLANFHSAALNPFNILFVLFGDKFGWSMYVICERIASGLGMYAFLNHHHKNKGGAIVGAVVYAMSPFMTTWAQFGTMGYAMAWLPLILICVSLFNERNNAKYLLPLPILMFLLVTAGQFQAMFLGLLFGTLYFFYTLNKKRVLRNTTIFITFCILGLLISAIQILPTFEYLNLSVRALDTYAQNVEYGLMPFHQLLSFFIPDFFGNPATGNYFGFFNYHETVIYTGVLAAFTVTSAILAFRKLGKDKFFAVALFISIIFIFRNPVSLALYEYHIPFLSTGVAGRMALITTFCSVVLISRFIAKPKHFSAGYLSYVVIFLATLSLLIFANNTKYAGEEYYEVVKIALRNQVFPILIATAILFAGVLRKTKLFVPAILFIVLIDLFRFGWKYEPQVKAEFAFPEMPSITSLTEKSELFRIEREKGPILPPNTWAYYRLQSPSGYDPMAPLSSTYYYFENYNHSKNIVSRYAESDYFDAKRLGEDNVAYLLLLIRNEKGEFGRGGSYFNPNVNLSDWEKVFEGDDVVVLENKFATPRVTASAGEVSISSYKNNKVVVNYKSDTKAEVILKDTYIPGWNAYFNGEKYEITPHKNMFRKVNLPAGQGELEFLYEPRGFVYGKYITLFSLILWGIVRFKVIKERG